MSSGNVLRQEHFEVMKPDPIIFALANPNPEIMPEQAIHYGAKVVGTGRSDLANQVNNALVFPGLFKGALKARVRCITERMKLAAASALASIIDEPRETRLLPSLLDRRISSVIADAVERSA